MLQGALITKCLCILEALKGVKLSNMIDVREYINDMDTCLAAADIVICRSGASTLAELEAAGFAA